MHGIVNLTHAFLCSVCNVISYTTQDDRGSKLLRQNKMKIIRIRGRPWRYSVIPSTPDFPTEYQIRRNSNPAGLPVFFRDFGTSFYG